MTEKSTHTENNEQVEVMQDFEMTEIDGELVQVMPKEHRVSRYQVSGDAVLEIIKARMMLLTHALPLAVSATTKEDWMDFQGRPWPKAKAVEAIRLLFNISATNQRMIKRTSKDEKGEYYFYECWMDFRLPGMELPVQCVGTSSIRKPFYAIKYVTENKKKKEIRKRLFEISEENVMKHAYTNCMANGVQTIIGMKGITWKQLQDSGLKQKDVVRIDFGGEGKDDKKKSAEKKTTEKKETKKDANPVVPDKERKETIEEFIQLHDFLCSQGWESDALCEKYLAYKKPLEDGTKFADVMMVMKFKRQRSIDQLKRAIKLIRTNEDLTDLEAWAESLNQE